MDHSFWLPAIPRRLKSLARERRVSGDPVEGPDRLTKPCSGLSSDSFTKRARIGSCRLSNALKTRKNLSLARFLQ